MSDYSVTLSTTDPNNYVGLIKLRQGDVDSQSIQATITANGQLFNFDRLAVFFNAVLPNGNVVRDKVTNVDYVNSKLNYIVANSFLQEVAQVTAWFSFENGDKIIDSTKNFQYSVIGGWKECIPQGNYIYELSEIQREIEEIIGNKDFTSLISKISSLETDVKYQSEKLEDFESANNSRLLSAEQQLAKAEHEKVMKKETYGTFEQASMLSVLANPTAGRTVPVMGIPDNNQALLVTYDDRDSVAFYAENRGTNFVEATGSVVYTSTTVTTTSDISKVVVGMIIDTMHTPNKYSGIVANVIGQTITVDAWYKVDGVTMTPQTPPNGIGFFINPVTKIWAANLNTYLASDSDTAAASGIELGVFGDKVGATVWGVDVVSFGTVGITKAFQARRSAKTAAKIEVGFYAERALTGFEAYQDNEFDKAFYTSVNGSNKNWYVQANGIQNKLRVQSATVANGIVVSDPNTSGYIFNKNVEETWTLPTVADKAGQLLFLYNIGVPVTIATYSSSQFIHSATGIKTSIRLPKNGNLVLMSNGTDLWVPVVRSFADVKTGIANPTGSVTPNYVGELFLNVTAKKEYRAFGLTSADWVEMN